MRPQPPLKLLPPTVARELTLAELLAQPLAEGQTVDLARLLRAPKSQDNGQHDARDVARQITSRLEQLCLSCLQSQSHLWADLPLKERQQRRRLLGEQIASQGLLQGVSDLAPSGTLLPGWHEAIKPLLAEMVQYVFQGRSTRPLELKLYEVLTPYVVSGTHLSELRTRGRDRGGA